MPVHFTSFALCGANPAMPFWEQNWGLEREGILEAAEKHVSISSTCGKGKSSRDLLLFGSCNLLLSCREKWWNLGCCLKCLFYRAWLYSQSVTTSRPLQTLVRGGTASLVCASVWYISLQKIQILYRQQGAGKSYILYIPVADFCVWGSNFLSRFWKLMPGWLWCPGGHSISFN